ncbi:hypothetical protein ACF3N0_08395 [Moraxella atlantae]|uniref:hypothetical protein n=1 Tax=Faucicola atlantae TaxID=34059 RepID=UPI003750FB0E
MSNHTPREAILIGATGLVGQTLLAILAQDYAKVTAIARRKPSTIAPNIDAHVLKDFAGLKDLLATLALGANTDAFSCLGTTRKAAGSAERFRQIDYGYNLAFAQAMAQTAQTLPVQPRKAATARVYIIDNTQMLAIT